MRALLGAAVVAACVGCAGPRAVAPPTVPVLLSHSSFSGAGERAPARAAEAAKPIGNARPDELLLDGSHFDPPIAAALRAYLRAELGPTAADKELVLTRVTVKIKSMAAASNVAGMVVAMPPGSPPGAGLAGALIAAAIIEGARSTSTASFVLVNIEGEFAGAPFAGFAYGSYAPDTPDSIGKVVMEAFAQAKASLAGHAQIDNGGISREAGEK
jgi:hypothetical protein